MKKKDLAQQAEKLSYRLATPYAKKVASAAAEFGIAPNQFGRIATMSMANNRFHLLAAEVAELREELRLFRREFQNALVIDEE